MGNPVQKMIYEWFNWIGFLSFFPSWESSWLYTTNNSCSKIIIIKKNNNMKKTVVNFCHVDPQDFINNATYLRWNLEINLAGEPHLAGRVAWWLPVVAKLWLKVSWCLRHFNIKTQTEGVNNIRCQAVPWRRTCYNIYIYNIAWGNHLFAWTGEGERCASNSPVQQWLHSQLQPST